MTKKIHFDIRYDGSRSTISVVLCCNKQFFLTLTFKVWPWDTGKTVEKKICAARIKLANKFMKLDKAAEMDKASGIESLCRLYSGDHFVTEEKVRLRLVKPKASERT